MSNDNLDRIASALRSDFGRAGQEAADNLVNWITDSRLPLVPTADIKQLLDESHLDLLLDSFWRDLVFGTGGRRGPVGYGPNRINPTMLAMTAQGHSNHLLEHFGDSRELSVVIANDVRVFNDIAGRYGDIEDCSLLGLSAWDLAVQAAEIYAGNGIKVYFTDYDDPDSFLTTPELSHAIRQLGAVGGINISASHNHPDDNGIKVYDDAGGQPIPPQDERLAEAMKSPLPVRRIPISQAIDSGLAVKIPAEIQGEYQDLYRHIVPAPTEAMRAEPIVYTPLNGCGSRSAAAALANVGFGVEIPPDHGPDGTFGAIPLRTPNPEVAQSTRTACDFAETVDSKLVLSSDPDADRIGAEVQLEGQWRHLNGNELASIISYYLMLDPEGPQRKGVVLETIVTTRLVGAIGREAGCQVRDDLLVGFKYVADFLRGLEKEGHVGNIEARAGDLVLATEESHGVMTTEQLRDKDSTPAVLILAAIHTRMMEEGRTLVDYLEEIYKRFGRYEEIGRSVVLMGSEGVQRMDALMESLRKDPPKELAGLTLKSIVDYWDEQVYGPIKSTTDRAARNVLHWRGDGWLCTVRPSGTEPKVKFYCHTIPHETPRDAEALSNAAFDLVLGRLGETLSPAARALVDVIPLSEKARFDSEVIPGLETRIREGWHLAKIRGWLAETAASMTPGADPLPAISDGLRLAFDQYETLSPSWSIDELLATYAKAETRETG